MKEHYLVRSKSGILTEMNSKDVIACNCWKEYCSYAGWFNDLKPLMVQEGLLRVEKGGRRDKMELTNKGKKLCQLYNELSNILKEGV